jgi:GGDEF domain-containing protein
VLPDTDGCGAQQVVANLARELRDAYAADNLELSCSIGVVTIGNPALPVEGALAAADALMYEVKRSGKGAVAFTVR